MPGANLSVAAKNTVGLYGLYAGYYLAGLLITPYLARCLGPIPFGRFSAFQALAATMAVFIEFGFSFSATAALQREHLSRSADRIISEVLMAKLWLSLPVSLVLLLVVRYVPALDNGPAFAALCLAAACCQGFSPAWIYQGYGRLIQYSALDMAIKALSVAAMFLWVHNAGDLTRAALFWTLGSFLSSTAGTLWIMRRVNWSRSLPPYTRIASRLRDCLSLFCFRAATNLQSVIGPVLLSVAAPEAPLGAYAGADKISKHLAGVLYPVIEALYPIFRNSPRWTSGSVPRHLALTLVLLTLAGAILSLGLFITAPLLTSLLLGSKYPEAVVFVRVLSPLPVVAALGQSVGVHWMVPMGMGRLYSAITGAMLALYVISTVALSHWYGALGMCWAQILTAVTASSGMLVATLVQFKRSRPLELGD